MSKDDKETPDETEQADGEDNVSRFPGADSILDDEETEYLVDIDTHHSILIVAHNPEEAAAKALHDEADDMRTTVVAHDVHVCVHSGISDNECDHEEGAE